MSTVSLFLACSSCLWVLVAGHGDLTWPPPRTRGSMQSAGSCNGPNPFQEGEMGTCFWFNQCCTPGQVACTGEHRLPDPEVRYTKAAVCGDANLAMEPAINDLSLRTWRDYNGVDFTKYGPWRNPGHAPVLGPCGMAGGWTSATQVLMPAGVKPGMDGVDLPKLDEAPQVWEAGSAQEVAWSIYVNHGGGYAYRLCPSWANQTEECFQQNHLRFVDNTQWIQYRADKSNRTAIPATRTARSTHPAGSMWTKLPIPPCSGPAGGNFMEDGCDKPLWEPPIEGLFGIGPGRCFPSNQTSHAPAGGGGRKCTLEEERFWMEKFNFNIVDLVEVPRDIVPGDYILSWRWDAEETPQVWTGCADVRITAAVSQDLHV